MGKKLQILFSCSFLFHLMQLKAAVLGKCFIRLPGCSHQPQLSQESLLPAKPEHKEHPLQSFYNSHAALHSQRPQANDHLLTKLLGRSDKQGIPPSLPTEKPAPPAAGTVLPFMERDPHLDLCILLGGSCPSSRLG